MGGSPQPPAPNHKPNHSKNKYSSILLFTFNHCVNKVVRKIKYETSTTKMPEKHMNFWKKLIQDK